MFTAPALLFFAITGGLQTFGLHEARRGSGYAPPEWLAVAGQLHKKQDMVVPLAKLRPAANPAARAANAAPAPVPRPAVGAAVPRQRNPLPLKVFTVLVALALAVSTLSGLYLAWKYTRHAGRIIVVSGAGIVVPILLALL
ncbi:MAG TPA: PepSY domain-containing protein [Rhodanobacter sp.]